MPNETAVAVAVAQQPGSLLGRMASRFGVDPNKMLVTLKATAFKGDVSNEQMMALLVVAEQYRLNPWVREIFAFPDKGGIVPVVGFDGWNRITNEHPAYNGSEITYGPDNKDGLPEWIECTVHRKDREHPTKHREYMSECKRGTGPWGSHPRRMLEIKARIQAARIAFGFSGIYDQDEAERIVEGETLSTAPDVVPSPIAAINAKVRRAKAADAAKTVEPASEPATADPRPPLELNGDPPDVCEAGVMDDMDKASNADALDAAASLADALPDPEARQRVRDRYHELKQRLTP